MSNRQSRPFIERRGLSPILIMLGIQIFQQFERLPNKPPVTIGLLLCNIIPHLYHISLFDFSLSDAQQNCVHPRIIINALFGRNPKLLLNRIILPGFMHADDTHLYYNMLSLCWKGIHLERELGSIEFLQLVIFSLLSSHTLMIILSYILHEIGFPTELTGYNSCAVGFSAVLFSLKYVWNQMSPHMTNVMGIFQVPSRYAAWCELIMISIISPNASFLGHLCGILSGILYLHLFQYLFVMLTNPMANPSYSTSTTSTRYTYASGTAAAVGHDTNRSSSSSSSSNDRNMYFDTSRSNTTIHAQNHDEDVTADMDTDALRMRRLNRFHQQNRR